MNDDRQTHGRIDAGGSAGFTYIEVLIAGTLLALTLLSVCSMFVSGYANVAAAGDATQGLAATRQLMESIRQLPFDSLANLDDVDTDDPNSVPDNGAEREIVRRWRFALAGTGAGWSFTDDERARWTDLSQQGNTLGAAGTIDIAPQDANLTQITVTVSVPGRWRPVTLTTLMARL